MFLGRTKRQAKILPLYLLPTVPTLMKHKKWRGSRERGETWSQESILRPGHSSDIKQCPPIPEAQPATHELLYHLGKNYGSGGRH